MSNFLGHFHNLQASLANEDIKWKEEVYKQPKKLSNIFTPSVQRLKSTSREKHLFTYLFIYFAICYSRTPNGPMQKSKVS